MEVRFVCACAGGEGPRVIIYILAGDGEKGQLLVYIGSYYFKLFRVAKTRARLWEF